MKLKNRSKIIALIIKELKTYALNKKQIDRRNKQLNHVQRMEATRYIKRFMNYKPTLIVRLP
jgi:hypothetical protein